MEQSAGSKQDKRVPSTRRGFEDLDMHGKEYSK